MKPTTALHAPLVQTVWNKNFLANGNWIAQTQLQMSLLYHQLLASMHAMIVLQVWKEAVLHLDAVMMNLLI